MKALELCKEALRILRRDKGDEYRYNVGILLKEAIEELEKFEKIKSYCEEQKDTWESQENGDHKVYEKILKELNK